MAVVALGFAALTFYPAGASAVTTPTGSRVLLLHADSGAGAIKTQLAAQSGIGSVDDLSTRTSTPSLTTLQQYDAVVTWTNNPPKSPSALGNVLADYLDGGGAVVAFNFSQYNVAPYNITGRFASGYSPYTYGNALYLPGLNGVLDPAKQLLAGVSTLTSDFRIEVALVGGATDVAKWSDGSSLAAVKGRVLGVNAYLGPNPAGWSGDWARFFRNFITSAVAVAPVVGVAPSDASGAEGTALSASGTFTDTDLSTIAKTAGVGTVTQGADGAWSWSHTPADDGSGQVTVKATDAAGSSVERSFTWTATNAAPVVTTSGPDAQLVDGFELTSAGAFSDVPADTTTLSASAGKLKPSADGRAWTWALAGSDNVPASVTVTATDDDGGLSTDTFAIEDAAGNPVAAVPSSMDGAYMAKCSIDVATIWFDQSASPGRFVGANAYSRTNRDGWRFVEGAGLIGTKANDVITGSPGDDILAGGPGDDKLCGGSGNDTLRGDAGSDFMYGGGGDDAMRGGDGDDFMSGGPGSDDIGGNAGNDLIMPGSGDDRVSGGDGADKLIMTAADAAEVTDSRKACKTAGGEPRVTAPTCMPEVTYGMDAVAVKPY